MKRLILSLLTACMAIFVAPSCSSQVKVLKKAADIDGVTSIYLSKTMLSLAGGISGVDGMEDIKPFIKKLNSIELVIADTNDAKRKLSAECAPVAKNLNGDMLTEINDKEDHVVIYAFNNQGPKEKTDELVFDGLLMLVDNADEYVAIYIDGNIDAKGLMESFAK